MARRIILLSSCSFSRWDAQTGRIGDEMGSSEAWLNGEVEDILAAKLAVPMICLLQSVRKR